MFCSIVIPTIGRETLSRAVYSVLEQVPDAEDSEIIVVNDSGHYLPECEWQHSERVKVVTTNRRERSVARNAGAAIARGQYLYFLDDDDWLLPRALEEFRRLTRQSEDAVWLYGGIQVVDETGTCLAEVNAGLSGDCVAQILGGAWVPIQASLVRTEAFFMAGGYDPSLRCTEDQDLCRRIALLGPFANMATPVACLFRGRAWHTSTQYSRAPEETRQSRDTVLSAPAAFWRLHASARSSYWRGRMLRLYLSAARWNLRHRRPFSAASRAALGLTGLVFAGPHAFSPDFWRAARAEHVPQTLHFIVRAIEQDRGAAHGEKLNRTSPISPARDPQMQKRSTETEP